MFLSISGEGGDDVALDTPTSLVGTDSFIAAEVMYRVVDAVCPVMQDNSYCCVLVCLLVYGEAGVQLL